jgi:ribonuclease Z
MNPLHNPGFSASLNFGHLTLEGYAVSAVASYIMAPTLNACFDLGHCPVAALPLSNIFLSHVHKDHSAGVPLYFSLRDMQKMGKAKVFVPSGSRGGLLRTLEAFDSMEGPNVPDRSGEVIGVSPGDVISLGRSYKVRVFDSIHRIESVGYTVFEHRSKLKPQYLGLSPAEIEKAWLSLSLSIMR